MPAPERPYVASWRRAGRLVPRQATGLRAGAVALPPGGRMDWHSTGAREELILMMQGMVTLELGERRPRGTRLRAGQCAWLPAATRHRVLNQGRGLARYVYVTGAQGPG